MSQDPLRGAIDTIRTQLQAELDAQLGGIERQHGEALDAARREAREEADARWQAELDRVRSESDSRLHAALAEAAAEAERRVASETTRVRVDAEEQAGRSIEQAREDAAVRARADAAQTFEAERAAQAGRAAQMQRDRDGAHERIAALERERARVETEREQEATASAAHAAERGAAERQSQLAAAERLLNSVRAISAARSLSDVLAALAEGAAAEASRAVALVPAGADLEGFRAGGFSPDRIHHPAPPSGEDVLHAAMRDRRARPVAPDTAPAFARLPPERAGLAVPITVGGQAVAVLYADNSLASAPEVPASWPEAIQILCLHASAALAHLTAVRTAQAARLMRPSTPSARPPAFTSEAETGEAARRYARLLVSEIKLYNEPAVRLGREKRDLLHRLRPEIERARRMYDERVAASLEGRMDYFEEELCQILAGGDAALLGREAVWP